MPRPTARHGVLWTSVVVGCGVAALVMAGCRGATVEHDTALAARLEEGASGRSISVPGEQPTVAAALAAAGPGDLILLSPGTYREQVEIDTPRVVLRGIDRNGVVFDGGNELSAGIVLRADGAVVENLTVRGYRSDGILVDGGPPPLDQAPRSNGVDGFRVSHVTAYANGAHGIRARAARGGLIESSFSSGHSDAGIAVENCRPCDTVVSASVGEANAAGFRAGDAGGGLFVVGSTWRANRVGLVLLAEPDGSGGKAPVRPAVTVAGNLVAGNANPAAPAGNEVPFGSGVVVSGPVAADVVRNRVSAHPGAGVAVTDLERRPPQGNQVRENELEANGTDLAFYLVGVAFGDTKGNCFSGNAHGSAAPADLEGRLPCHGRRPARPVERSARFPAPRLPTAPPAPAGPVAPPPPQAQSPLVAAPAQPAPPDPPPVDLATLVVPAAGG